MKPMLSAIVGIGGGCLILLLPVLASKFLNAAPSGGFRAMAVIATTLVGEAWALVFATRMHRSSDEFQQQRAKSAWYWGGSIGLAMTFPISLFIVNGGLDLVDPGLSMSRPLIMAFACGFVLPCVGLTVGYFGARFSHWGNEV
ncbi:hypothetical protein [Sphingomonas sp.]|uniref:hypothetical protein n=1 Tax=Sphingomonas sp. TaxID=28214 RepID=UPI0025F8BC70|nr:hypothetical protein [Sphingomonas sp.]